ncbi:MAG: hypothetical protein ACOCX5_06130 [Chloroflexota bacterium]
MTHQQSSHSDPIPATARFCSPFTFHYGHIERLLLINFTGDPDTVYVGFEPQIVNDPVKGKGLLVIAWRQDGTIDVYHQPQLTLQREDYDIVGDGLSDFIVCPFDDAQFLIGERGVDLNIEFTDKKGRTVRLHINEQNRRRRKPFGLLAPFPGASKKPPSMPLALLYDFYFVRRARTEISVEIDGRQHQLDMLPAPIDGSRVYFVRYSPDPFIVLFNPAYDGPLPVQSFQVGDSPELNGAIHEVQASGEHAAIKALRTSSQRHQVRLSFTPAFPDLLHMQDGIDLKGTWHMDLEKAIGYISGTYHVQRSSDRITIDMHPSDSWHPRITKLSVWFMFKVVPIFKHWPRSYHWHADIDLNQAETPHLSARWYRTE